MTASTHSCSKTYPASSRRLSVSCGFTILALAGWLLSSPHVLAQGSPQPAPAGPARAAEPAWEKLGETPVLTLYIDRSTIQREGSIRRVVEIQDLKVPDPDGVLSRRYINEYDCENQMHRIGRMSSWSGAGLTGKKLFDLPDWGYWRKVPQNGLFTVGFRLLCPPRVGDSLER